MNKLLLTLSAAALALLTACSNDEPTGVDTSILDGVSRGETAVKFDIADCTVYEDLNDGKGWQKFDFSDLFGWEMPAPHSIIFQNGVVLYEESLFSSSSGPDPVLIPLQAYMKSTKKNFNVYISSPLAYNEETGILKIGSNDYRMTTLTNSTLKMEIGGHIVKYVYGKEGQYNLLTKLEYQSVDFTPIDLENNLVGTDLTDIQRKVITMCRNHFGSTIDLTSVYGGAVILDAGNIIDLDQLEAGLGL